MAIDFKAVFFQSPAPSMILNSKFEFVAANPAYLKMVGMRLEQVEGKHVFDVFPETEERKSSMLAVFEDALGGNHVTISEIPFRISVDGKITEQWWTARHAPLADDSTDAQYIIQYSENVTEQVKMREMRNALLGEMQHRIGNIFAIISAIARQTSRAVDNLPDFLTAFEQRVGALMKVNRHLTQKEATGGTLASVIKHQLAVHSQDAQKRITVQGPEYQLSMLQSQAISMALHELGTNSMKYGAIGQDGGKVAITWDLLPNEGCLLRWEETNITVKESTDKGGYGTMLLTTIIPSQLNGTAAREMGESAFKYSLEIGSVQ